MIDSTNDLYFSDYEGGKVVGTHTGTSSGNGLKNKEAKEIIIPEKYLGTKVTEIGMYSFWETNIESVFVSRYIKSILYAAFYLCKYLKYITFDSNSELESLGYHLIGSGPIIESINLPSSLKKTLSSSEPSIYHTPTLKCASYFGNNDLSSSYVFRTSNLSSDFVVYTLPSYKYNIKAFTPKRTGQRCQEKRFSIQNKKAWIRSSCQHVNSLMFMIVLLVSWKDEVIEQNYQFE